MRPPYRAAIHSTARNALSPPIMTSFMAVMIHGSLPRAVHRCQRCRPVPFPLGFCPVSVDGATGTWLKEAGGRGGGWVSVAMFLLLTSFQRCVTSCRMFVNRRRRRRRQRATGGPPAAVGCRLFSPAAMDRHKNELMRNV